VRNRGNNPLQKAPVHKRHINNINPHSSSSRSPKVLARLFRSWEAITHGSWEAINHGSWEAINHRSLGGY